MLPEQFERRVSPPHRAASRPTTVVTIGVCIAAALGALNLAGSGGALGRAPFASFLGRDALPYVRPSANAFGESGEVKIRFALPGQRLEYPLEVEGDPSLISYAWSRVGDATLATVPRPLGGAELSVPPRPGFYRLVLLRGDASQMMNQLAIAVLMPFQAKVAGVLNGYRIGTYVSERLGALRTPEGFLEIMPADLDLPVTKHLRVGDFVAHDKQHTWPRYAAVSPRLLDKIELVVAEIARWHGTDTLNVTVDVRSGFRSPEHNRKIRRAARDSRHQYGDAADVSIDANGDGRLTEYDGRLVGLAVELVELRHPELAGGLGLYLRGRTPYVHIDARGKRARWRG